MGRGRLRATLLLQRWGLSSHTIKSWNGRVPATKEARNIEPFFHFDSVHEPRSLTKIGINHFPSFESSFFGLEGCNMLGRNDCTQNTDNTNRSSVSMVELSVGVNVVHFDVVSHLLMGRRGGLDRSSSSGAINGLRARLSSQFFSSIAVG